MSSLLPKIQYCFPFMSLNQKKNCMKSYDFDTPRIISNGFERSRLMVLRAGSL